MSDLLAEGYPNGVGITGRKFPDSAPECGRNLWPDVIGFPARMLSDSMAECGRNSHPTFIENFTEEDVSKDIYTEYNNKIKMYKNSIGNFSKYFFYNLHDSKIISLENIHHNLCLKLNDVSTLDFAYALIDKFNLKIDKSEIIFPLEIISEETSHLSLNSVDINGTLFANHFVELKEYLYEEIIEWNDKNIEIAFDLCNMNLKPYRYVLLLRCKKLILKEGQNKYWRKYFGEDYNKYYECFIMERNEGNYLADYTECTKLIDKIMEKKYKMPQLRITGLYT
jgi:hypothetical protein